MRSGQKGKGISETGERRSAPPLHPPHSTLSTATQTFKEAGVHKGHTTQRDRDSAPERGAALDLAKLQKGIDLGGHSVRLWKQNVKGHALVQIDGWEYLLALTVEKQFPIFVALLQARYAAQQQLRRSPFVSLTRILRQAGLLGEQIRLTDLDAKTRQSLQNALRGHLRGLRQRMEPFGLRLCHVDASTGNAMGYFIAVQEEFEYAPETPYPIEVNEASDRSKETSFV